MSSKRRVQTLPATKNHQGLGDSEDESDTKIFSVPVSETGQQSSPQIQLKLMRRQPQQGSADRVLVELTNRKWFSVVYSLIDYDTRHRSGQNVVDKF